MSYKNKRILFMGDSITAQGVWVKIFNEIVEPECFVNIAVSRARWQDSVRTVYDGNPVMNEPDKDGNNTLCNQLEKLMRGKDPDNANYKHNPDYDGFDIIMISAGTNDYMPDQLDGNWEEIISAQFTEGEKTLPSEKVNRLCWPGAMRAVYEGLRKMYPNADIFFCSPIQGAEDLRPYASIKARRDYMKLICERISDVTFVDTFSCGICGIYEKSDINGRDLYDGLHPNENGALKIARYNANAIKQFYL